MGGEFKVTRVVRTILASWHPASPTVVGIAYKDERLSVLSPLRTLVLLLW